MRCLFPEGRTGLRISGRRRCAGGFPGVERMAAFPAGYDEANRMRAVMGYGNRMYLAQPDDMLAPANDERAWTSLMLYQNSLPEAAERGWMAARVRSQRARWGRDDVRPGSGRRDCRSRPA